MRYGFPSSVRVKYHQPPLRNGTDRSVSWVRPLISSKIASCNDSMGAITASA